MSETNSKKKSFAKSVLKVKLAADPSKNREVADSGQNELEAEK